MKACRCGVGIPGTTGNIGEGGGRCAIWQLGSMVQPSDMVKAFEKVALTSREW